MRLLDIDVGKPQNGAAAALSGNAALLLRPLLSLQDNRSNTCCALWDNSSFGEGMQGSTSPDTVSYLQRDGAEEAGR